MKTLALSLIAISGIFFAGIFFHNAYAPCALGMSSCGPPPGVTVEIWTNNSSYDKNDTITVNGMLYSSTNGTAIPVQLYNPQNILIKTYNVAVNASNKFSLKINGNFNDSGQYVLAACNHDWCDREYIKIIASPYILQYEGHAFPINYRTIADVDNMSVNTGEDSLLIHLSGAPIGSIFQISMPRNLIDSTFANGTDYDFTVLAGENSVQKLMSKANFNETQTNQISRTLEIKIPSYSQLADMQGEMYVKIIGTKMYEDSGLETLSPLQQFKSGIAAKDVICVDDLSRVIKTEDGTPACVKSDTAQILIERGWGMNISSNNTDTNTADDGILSGNVTLAGGPSVGPQANYEVDVYATDGITIVGKTFSDINAHYSIPLSAGKYIIYAQDYPKPIQHLVSVFKGKTTTFDILYCTNCK